MNKEKTNDLANKATNKLTLFSLYSLVIITIIFLILKINIELESDYYNSFDSLTNKQKQFFTDLKKYPTIGWFNLNYNIKTYKKGVDFQLICTQYMSFPTILESFTFNKRIVCFYSTPEQLITFCNTNRKYRLLKLNTLTRLAILERIN